MRTLFFLGLFILSVPIVQARNATVEALPPFLQSRVVASDPLMDFRTQSVPQGRVDRDTNVLRAAYRLAPIVPLGATHETTARAYLDAEAERFDWAATDNLLLVHEIDGHYSAHLTFQQTFGGIPVHNRFEKVSMGPGGHSSMVISGYAPHLREADHVRLQPLMDADTGEILYLRNQVSHRQAPSSAPARAAPLALASLPASAEPATVPAVRAVVGRTGFVFDPDPLTSAAVLYVDPYVDNDDADVAVLNAERKEVVLRDITQGADGLYWTSGEDSEMAVRVTFPVGDGHNPDLPNGGLWATTMMEIYDELGKRVTDRLILASHAYLGSSSILVDKAEALLQADEDLYAGENESVLREKLVAGGYLSAEDDAQSAALVLTILRSGGRPIREGRSRTLSVSVELDAGVAAADISVDISITGGTAEEGADYRVTSAPSQVVIPEGYSDVFEDIQIQTVDDDIAEGNETIVIEVSAPGLTSASQNLTIRDNDTASTALVLAGKPSSPREEGRSRRTVDITVSLNADASTTDIPVEISVMDGTAEEDADYRVLSVPDALVIPAGELSVMDTVRIRIIDDNIAEGDETVVIGASAPGLRSVSWNLTIRDDDVASDSLVLTINPGSLDEGSGAKIIGVKATLNGAASTADIPVEISVTDGTAEEDADYRVSSNPISLVIPRGMTSVTGAVPITIVDDDIVEGDETVTVEASATGLTSASEEFTIRDNEAALSVTLGVSPSSVSEDVSTAPVVTVTATVEGGTFANPQTVMVSVGVPKDSAEEGIDYAAVSDFSIPIPADVSSGAGTFPLDPVDDVIFEGNETLTVSGSLSGGTVTPIEFTITDDDAAPTSITLSVSPSSVAEDVGTATSVTVTATVEGSSRFSEAQTLTVSVGGGGGQGNAVAGTDYTEVSDFTLTIAATAASGTHTFELSPVNDSISEGDETISVEGVLSGVAVTTTEITITDDDAAPTSIALSVSPSSVAEDVGTATSVTVTATVEGSSRFSEARTLTVSVGKSGDSAVEGTDYMTVSDIELTIAATAASGTHTFELSPMNDSISEGDKTISVQGVLSGVTVTPTEFTITDDDAAPTSITLSVSPSSVAEDVGTAQTVTATATVEGSSRFSEARTLTVSVGKSGDSAVEGTDYGEVDDVEITISATAASGTDTFTLAPVDDDIFEGNETLTVSGSLSGVTVTPTEITITDNDAASMALMLTISPGSVDEDADMVSIAVTVAVDGGTFVDPQTVMVSVGASRDSAVEGTDYAVVDDFPIVIPAGDASATGTLTLFLVDDDIQEPGGEFITIEASASGLTSASQELVIEDDDTSPLSVSLIVSFSVADRFSVAERSRVAEEVGTTPVVTVTATVEGGWVFAGPQTVTVSVGTLEDSATEGTDYVAVDDYFMIMIPARSFSATGTFTLDPIDDTIAEGSETVSVVGTLLSGATVMPAKITITDKFLTLEPNTPFGGSIFLVEGSLDPQDARFIVNTRGNALTSPIPVTISVIDGTATSPADYTVVSVPSSLVIPAGSRSVRDDVEINVIDDNLVEETETITIFASASGFDNTASLNVAITDNDAPSDSLVVTLSPNSAVEGAGTANIDVTVGLNASARTTDTEITLTVSDGTATSPEDYSVSSPSVTLQIPEGMPSVTETVPIAIVDDNTAEEAETLTIAAEATGLTSASEDFTITDNDAPSDSLVVTLSPNSAVEGAGTANVDVTVGLNASARTTATSVTLTISDDVATSPEDYSVSSPSVTLQIPEGMTEVTETIPIAIVDDNTAEEDETVTIAAEATGLTSASEEFAITDNDAPSDSLVVTLSPESAVEGAGTVDVDVIVGLNASARTTATSVTLTISDDVATSPEDYSVSSPTVTLQIPAGMTSVTETVPITIVDDNTAEEDETVMIAVEATGLTSASEEFAITDNDAASTDLVVTLSPASVVEGAGTANVDVTVGLNARARTTATSVTLTISDDVATSPEDYSVSSPTVTLQITAGMTSVTETVPIAIVDDNTAEEDETVTIAAEATGLTSASKDFTITDNDAAPTSITLSVSPSSVAEDVGTAQSVTVTATVEGSSRFSEAQTLTVSVGKSGDSAVEETDYGVVDDFAMVIPADDASATGTFLLALVNDAFAEGEETLTVSGLLSGVTVTATEFTITDDDTESTALVVTISPESAKEDAGTVDVSVTVRLDAGTRPSPTEITITVLDGTTLSPGDYSVSPPSVTLQIPAGMTEVRGTVPIAIVNDNIAEEDETVTLQATATGLTSDSEDFTITDNDTASDTLVLTIVSAVPVRLHEDSGTSWIRFKASLNSAAAPMDTPVDVSVTGGTATRGADYSISVIPSSIMIPAGETSIGDSLQITITDDDAVEGNETVVIEVSATGLTGTMQDLVIIDDETAVRIDVINVIAQDDGSYTVTAAVRQNMGAPVTSVVLYYGDGVAFEMAPMQSLGSLYTAELMAPDEGGILYYYVVATNGDGLTATYPPDGRYWDISNYTDGSRLVLLDFENEDAGDKSTVRHYVAYKGDAPTLAEGVLALDGLDDYAEILGSDLGASEEFALEILFNADDFDAVALDGSEIYLVTKPAGCSTCWGESTFSLLWGGSDNSDTYVAARFWNSEYEGEQIELEVPLSLVAGQWYHAVLEMQKEGTGQRAVLQLRDRSGLLYGGDAVVLPASPAISRYPIFVGHIGDRGFFDGRIDDVAFYNYAHFGLLSTSVEDVREVPEGYVLEQNYPNPFNPVTTIRYDLARVGHVSLEVSDLLGRRVAMLVDRVQQAGAQEVRFDAGELPSGMYLYRLRVEDFVSVKKMVLLK